MSPRTPQWVHRRVTDARGIAVALLIAGCAPGGSGAPGEPPPAPVEQQSDGLVPVADDDGNRVGLMRTSDLDALPTGDRDAAVPVYDAEGRRIGLFRVEAEGGYEPDDG